MLQPAAGTVVGEREKESGRDVGESGIQQGLKKSADFFLKITEIRLD
jgi:hypothetical protein